MSQDTKISLSDEQILKREGVDQAVLIRTNHRWSAYEGIFENKKVFIKICQDLENLSFKLSTEIKATNFIKTQVNNETPFQVPVILKSGTEYIIYEFLEAKLFSETNWFNSEGLKRLYSIYNWFEHEFNDIEVNFLDKQKAINRFVKKAKELEEFILESREVILRYFDADYYKCLEYALDYLKDNLGSLNLKPSHCDLTPGNILVDEENTLYLIDWESFNFQFENYDIVNFTYNYSLWNYKDPQILLRYASEFCSANKLDKSTTNLAFCYRFLTRVRESWGERSPHSASQGSADYTPEWLELSRSMMKAVIDGKFFFEITVV